MRPESAFQATTRTTAGTSTAIMMRMLTPDVAVWRRLSVIVTTNLPFENWTEVLGSERLTGATLDRLTHRCHILETKGESYRLQDAKRRRRTG